MFMHRVVTKRSNLDIHLFLTGQDSIMIIEVVYN